MSTEYEGQPEYVRASFLRDLLEPWVEVLPNEEWGGYVKAMWHLGENAIDPDNERSYMVFGWMIDELTRAFDAEWWGQLDDLLPDIDEAQNSYDETVAEKRGNTRYPKEKAALEEVIAGLPDWIRPTTSPEDRLRNELLRIVVKRRELGRELGRLDAESRRIHAELEGLNQDG